MAIKHLFESATPASTAGSEGKAVLVTRFTTTKKGKIVSLRFFKRATNTTTSARLFLFQEGTTTPIVEVTVTYTSGASGWVEKEITPVEISTGVNYYVDCEYNSGFYAYTASQAEVKNSPLAALSGGKFRYSTEGVPYPYPEGTSTNGYFIDIGFEEEQAAPTRRRFAMMG